MSMEFFSLTKDIYSNNYFILLYAAALVYLVIRAKEQAKFLIIVMVAAIVIILNPISYQYIWMRLSRGSSVYWRLFWMLPVIPAIACAVTHLINHNKKTRSNIIAFIVVIIVIAFSGHFIYQDYGDNTNFHKAENRFKIPQDAILVADALLEMDEQPRAIMPLRLISYIRQYSSAIQMEYGRNALGYGGIGTRQKEIFEEMLKAEPDVSFLKENMIKSHKTWLVLDNEQVSEEIMTQNGYRLTKTIQGTMASYQIYQLL